MESFLNFLFFVMKIGFCAWIFVWMIKSLFASSQQSDQNQLVVTHLNEEQRIQSVWLEEALLPPAMRAVAEKAKRKAEKAKHKKEKKLAKQELKKGGAKKEQEKKSNMTPAHSTSSDQEKPESIEQKTGELNTILGDTASGDTILGDTILEDTASKDRLSSQKSRLFVLDFKGDIQASAVENLRCEINALLNIKRDDDEVLVRLHNTGGYVHTHGLAASQLTRFKEHNLSLTIAVDQVAASGGYMMACVGERIIAAPFAIVGSIGVIAQLPNINRLLKRFDVDVELHTAGQYKRTLTTLGENTPEGREKFISDLHEVHNLFKNFITQQRPNLDIDAVATGETWYGVKAYEQGLIDEIKTSDEYIQQAMKSFDVYTVKYQIKKTLGERLHLAAHALLNGRLPEL